MMSNVRRLAIACGLMAVVLGTVVAVGVHDGHQTHRRR